MATKNGKEKKRKSDSGNEPRRQTYLITYSQADLSIVPTRESFAEIWVNAFGGPNAVKHWACCMESHEDGNPHYHLALKLMQRTRWVEKKNRVEAAYPGLKCHFKEFHTCYEDAFEYIKKEDEDYVVSDSHPYLLNRPRTAKATESRMNNSRQTNEEEDEDSGEDTTGKRGRYSGRREKVKLDEISVYEIITRQNIKTEDDLLLEARLQYDEGKSDLLSFVMRQTASKKRELIKTAWGVKDSKRKANRKKMTRMEILREARDMECVCNDQYRLCAVEVLERNEVDIAQFKAAILKAVEFGRDKGNNVMLTGLSNCGKTFLLKPLLKVFETFSSPATGTFAWVGAEKAEVVLLNDLRWCEKLIAWSDFLNLLEGWPIHVPAPKTHFSEDIVWEAKTPIFATSDDKLVKYEGHKPDKENTRMMDNRWVYFDFRRPLKVTRKMEPCGRCFARFIMS